MKKVKILMFCSIGVFVILLCNVDVKNVELSGYVYDLNDKKANKKCCHKN